LRNAAPPDVAFAFVNGAVTRIVPQDAALVSVESGDEASMIAPRALCDLWFDAPELKAVSADGRFDRSTGKFVRRSVPGGDRTNLRD
jgi:hypothetical protein